ncbi:hypothetical protein [Amycolatopsis anabasis]|uniref:hypothetical protein n=1 Tax=Amycolatopsis anabasis TaxID=1840409 RepID=UPI00131E24CE|nr:hypothetical protein [Amycolatopsis anabasis]
MVKDQVSEKEALTAVRMLVAAGFLSVPIGDPEDLHMLLFIREWADVRDAVKVYDVAEAEAVRIVQGRIVNEASGTTQDVVDAVLGWSSLITATGFEFR